MTSHTDTPRTPLARIGALGAIGLGVLALAGCATTETTTLSGVDTSDDTTSETTDSSSSDTTSDSSDTTTTDTDSDSDYADGTYTATGSYTSPGGTQSIEVEITLEDDIVTAVTVTPAASDDKSERYQEQFAAAIASEVVGEDIDSLSVSRVAGSSLTSTGFNAAIATIKSEAAA